MATTKSTVEECIADHGRELGIILHALIKYRDDCIGPENFDAESAVEASHCIAAINTGCIKQVKEYVPSGD